MLVNKIRNNQPIDTTKRKYTDKQIKHWNKCKDPLNCEICKKIIGEY